MSALYGVIGYNIVNYIGLRGNHIIRHDDYHVSNVGIKIINCIKYDEIEQIILKNMHPTIKFYNKYELDEIVKRYYRNHREINKKIENQIDYVKLN